MPASLGLVRVALLGNSQLGDTICRSLQKIECIRSVYWNVASVTGCKKGERSVSEARERMVREGKSGNENRRGLSAGDVEVTNLVTIVKGYDAAICAIEGCKYLTLFEVDEACVEASVPCVFVCITRGKAVLGPTVLPGISTCFSCSVSHWNRKGLANIRQRQCSTLGNSAQDDLLRQQIALRTAREVHRILGKEDRPSPRYVDEIEVLSREESTTLRASSDLISPIENCPRCSRQPTQEHNPLVVKASISVAIKSHFPYRDGHAFTLKKRYKAGVDNRFSIGVIGGGSAGYLAALSLHKKVPYASISLVESSKIPIIGVGEATTPKIVDFLHRDLGFDQKEFYEKVRPPRRTMLQIDSIQLTLR